MSKLEIEMNDSIDDLIVRLQSAKENPSPQKKMDMVTATGVQLTSTVDFWNYKLEKYRNNV
jgi:hypothetical protein